MYYIKFSKKLPENILLAIEKYYKNYDGSDIKKHFNIEPKQFQNIHQQMDTGGPYKSFDEMYNNFNKEPGTFSNITISKVKYKNVFLLLQSYYNNIVIF